MYFRNLISGLLILIGIPAYTQQADVLTLPQVLKLAVQQNKKIKAANYEIGAAEAAKKSVMAAAYPDFSATVMAAHLGKPLGGALNGLIPNNIMSANLNAILPVYAGGKIENGKAAAATVVEIYEAQKKMTTAEVLLSAEKAYWQIVQVKEKIILAHKYEQMLQILEKDLENSYKAGLIYKNDLLRVQVSHNEAKLSIDKANDGLEMAKLQLAQIVGMEHTDFELDEKISLNNEILEMPLIPDVSIHRPEITAFQKNIQAMELEKKIIRADNLPTVGLAVSGAGNVGKNVNLKDGSNSMVSYFGLINVSIPIFDWGKNAAKVKEQTLKIAARQQEMGNLKELISLEVKNAYLLLNQAFRQISVAEQSLRQADENLKLANDRLSAGTIVGKDVQEAQVIWQEAYSKLIEARIEYKVNEAVYKKAICKQ